MAIRRIRAGGGLSTDASELDQPEALRVAENVLLHRPGVIQPRLGFGDTTGIAARTGDYRPIAIEPFDGDLVVQSHDGSGGYRLERGSVDTSYGALAPPAPTVSGVSSFAQMRGSLYATSDAGVRKLDDAAATAHEAAGVPTDYVPLPLFPRVALAPTDRAAIGTESAVAYRYVWAKRDANDYLRRSAPSPRAVYRNDDAVNGQFLTPTRIYLPTGIEAGDFIEIYRTANATPDTADPGDEMYLAVTHEITAADVSAGYIARGVIWDMRADTELGGALYTNASQGGILVADELPPLANAIASWGDVMWLGATTERPTLSIEPVAVYDTTREEYDLDGVHYSTDSGCSLTSGSPTITVSTTRGLKVGQYVTDGSYPVVNDATDVTEADRVNLPAETKLTAIVSKVTIANNANITSGDEVQFSNLTSAVGVAHISWNTSIQSGTIAAIGADAGESADNLAASINASDKTMWGGGVLTATSDGVDTVTITSGDGHGLPIAFNETTPGACTVAYEITVDKNAKQTASSQSLDFIDYIVVNDVELYFTRAGVPPTLISDSDQAGLPWRAVNIDTTTLGSTTGLDQAKTLVQNLGDAINALAIRADSFDLRAYYDAIDTINPTANFNDMDAYHTGPTVLRLIATDPLQSITVEAPVRPASFRFSATEATSLDTHKPGRLFWSKPNQPEAVPFINFTDVGDIERRILALVPLENALLVFKEDGLYSVTGSAPASWVVDEVDTSTRLVAPQATCVLDDVCFALTDRGVVAATAGGVQVVSGPIASELRAYTRLLPRDNADPKRAFWMVANPRLGLVVLSVGEAADDEVGAVQYVFHARAGGRWSKWLRTDRCAAYDPAEDRMVVSPGIDSWTLLYERTDEDDAASYVDASITGVVLSEDDSDNITIAASEFDGHTPAAGDVLKTTNTLFEPPSTSYARITGLSLAGGTYTVTVSGFVVDDEATWYQHIPSAIEWQAQHLPGLGSRWQEAHVALVDDASEYVSTWPLDVGGTPSQATSASTVTATITPCGAPYQTIRIGLPRALVRAYQMGPRIAVACAGVLWRVAELALHFTPQSRRVRR